MTVYSKGEITHSVVNSSGESDYRNQWGAIRQIHLPWTVFRSGHLDLSPNAVKVLLKLYSKHKEGRSRAKEGKTYNPDRPLALKQKTLHLATGISSPSSMNAALTELREQNYVRVTARRKKAKRKTGGTKYGSNAYELLNPTTGTPLVSRPNSNLLFGNGLPYFQVPSVFVSQTEAPNSMAHLKSGPMKVYLAVLWLSNRARSLKLATDMPTLRSVADMQDTRTLRKALDNLDEAELLTYSEANNGGTTGLSIELFDPLLGDSVYDPHHAGEESNPANYRIEQENDDGELVTKGRPSYRGSKEQNEALMRTLFSDGKIEIVSSGNLHVLCPFHDDKNPSLGIQLSPYFIFGCFACKEGGRHLSGLRKLVRAKTGCTETDAIRIIAEAYGQPRLAFVPQFRPGDVFYDYKSPDGSKILKRKIRKRGKKDFTQCRPAKGGWINDVEGVPPSLFNQEKLRQEFGTVGVLEGEKDACTFTDLELYDRDGMPIIGVTSGSSGSWRPILAPQLKGKRVLVFPHADESRTGESYAVSVTASLRAQGIEHKVISLQGTGFNDVTDYLAKHSPEELASMIGSDWVQQANTSEHKDAEHTDVEEI